MATSNRFIKVGGEFIRPDSQQPVPAYGSQVTDSMGRVGTAMFDPNTGSPLQQPAQRQLDPQQLMQQNDPVSLSNFQQANPGLNFNQQDMQQYQNAGAPPKTNPFETGDYSSITDPHDAFNAYTFELLKRAQGVDSNELYKRRREIQRASIGAMTDPVNDTNIPTLSSDQLDSIAQGRQSALSVEADQNAADIAKHETAIQNFLDVSKQAQTLGKDFADNMIAPDSIIESMKKKIEANPESLSLILGSVNDKTKNKIIQSLDYSKLKPKTTGEDPNRQLSISEAKDLGVPYGTTVGQAIKMGKVPGGSGSGIDEKVAEQDALDAQTVNSAYQTIQNITSKLKKSPENLTEDDINKLSNTDVESIGKALARMQNPDIARQGGDAGNALDATSIAGKISQFSQGATSGKKYLASEVLQALKTGVSLKRTSTKTTPSGLEYTVSD